MALFQKREWGDQLKDAVRLPESQYRKRFLKATTAFRELILTAETETEPSR
jgi:hypothetical protein